MHEIKYLQFYHDCETVLSVVLQSLEMIDTIRDAFIDLVEQSTWMDTLSKDKAIEKVN